MQMITIAYNHTPSLGEGNGYPLQYSCLENLMDRGAWRATVHGATKSWTSISMSQIQTAKYFCMVRMWSNRKSHSLLAMQNGAATLEDKLVVSYKIKHVLIIHSSSQAPKHLLNRCEKEYPHKNMLQMFTAMWATIIKYEIRYPSIPEWTKKSLCIHIM